MKYLIYIFILLAFLSCEQTEYKNPGYTLVFEDNFQADDIDESKWNFEIGTGCQYGVNLDGWGNFEDQYYRQENATIIENDFLQIEAKRDTVFYSDCGPSQVKYYSSARLNTKNKFDFTYGKVEASIKIGTTAGVWHAFWMLPTYPQSNWPMSGEIDIFELSNNENILYSTTLHHTTVGTYIQEQIDFPDQSYFEDFHLYTIEWDISTIKWYVDDVLVQSIYRSSNSILDANWPFDTEFHLILNTAVGGTLGGTPDFNGESQYMHVDYVRVYQKIGN